VSRHTAPIAHLAHLVHLVRLARLAHLAHLVHIALIVRIRAALPRHTSQGRLIHDLALPERA